MPIHLITGRPGSGKTLYTLSKLMEERERKIYFNGIPELRLAEWQEIEDPRKWDQLENGSIVVVDECWRFWPQRTKEKEPPEVSAFRTHRHRGFDFYFISQSPMDVDVALRRLVDEHWHIVRPVGMEQCVVYRHMAVRDKPDDISEKRLAADQLNFVYPKEVYEIYKSADIHTIKSKPPRVFWKLVIIAIGVLVAVLAAAVALNQMKNVQPQVQLEDQLEGIPGRELELKVIDNQVNKSVAIQESKNTEAHYMPVIKGLPWTSPFYSDVFTASTWPKPHCISGANGQCKCYTQQATRMIIPRALCIKLSTEGFFDPTKQEVTRGVQARTQVTD